MPGQAQPFSWSGPRSSLTRTGRAATSRNVDATGVRPEMVQTTTLRERASRRPRLAVECALLYVAAPLAVALFVPPNDLFLVLVAATLAAAALLCVTPGFRWSELFRGWSRIDWRTVGIFTVVSGLICAALTLWLLPSRFLSLPQDMTRLWLLIMVLYPLLSVLPQELVFRVLLHRRYGELAPGRTAEITAGAAFFALVHLSYWNWVAVVLTFAGGLVFGKAYLKGGFPSRWCSMPSAA